MSTPTPLILFCPVCTAQHLDVGEWATRLHRTHLCLDCGHLWRPSEDYTVGVETLPSASLETSADV